MAKYISILRGINVSGQKKIKMADLTLLYQALGFSEVITYIQSGNVIFKTESNGDIEDKARVKAMLEQAIKQQYGFDVPVEIRTVGEFNDVLNNIPFGDVNIEQDGTKILVTFLSDLPSSDRVNALELLVKIPERLVVDGTRVYLHCPDGYGKSKLSNTFIEHQLGVSATTRNWKTVTTLCQLAHE